MLMSELFGRTLRPSSGAPGSGRRGADAKIVPLAEMVEELGRRLGSNYVKVI